MCSKKIINQNIFELIENNFLDFKKYLHYVKI